MTRPLHHFVGIVSLGICLWAATIHAEPTETAPLDKVTLSLDDYRALVDDIERLQKLSAQMNSSVHFGAADYTTKASTEGLHAKIRLFVHLGDSHTWKTIPLLDDKAGIISVYGNGRALALTTNSGMHQWNTNLKGAVNIDIEALIPSAGPRGAIEYDFVVPQTPLTRFSCDFPIPKLEPKVDGAVGATSVTVGSHTRYEATLRSVSRIHLVGFRDLDDGNTRAAKIYAETLHLVSVGDQYADVFSVIRYNILYAGNKKFHIRIPKGLEVLQADGEGAFTYELDKPLPDGSRLLRGETAFPIRNQYEISLRLRRAIQSKNTEDTAETTLIFQQPHPVADQVERVYGWLGVEVTGKLNIQPLTKDSQGAVAVDLRQLPVDMLQNAVSPILHAFRLQDSNARVALHLQALPELELTSDSVDRIRATSVLTDDGKLLTEMRITMRNRLRPQLRLQLKKGTHVRSSFLDGAPVKPSRDKQGALILPLKNSAGGERPKPFILQVTLESDGPVLGYLGWPKFSLPSVDLPVSSLIWLLHLPARNRYGAPLGDVEEQHYSGAGQFYEAPLTVFRDQEHHARSERQRRTTGTRQRSPEPAVATLHEGDGDMPVRFKLPRQGTVITTHRYWLSPGTAIHIRLPHLRGWLRIPLLLLLLLGVALGVSRVFGGNRGRGKRYQLIAAAFSLLAAVGAARLGSTTLALYVALATAMGTLWLRYSSSTSTIQALNRWKESADRLIANMALAWGGEKRPWLRSFWGLFLVGSATIVLLLLLLSGLRLAHILANPLP